MGKGVSKKILINGITLEGANIVPLLLKIGVWQSFGCDVTMVGSEELERQVHAIAGAPRFDFIRMGGAKKPGGRFRFLWEALKRNWVSLFYIRGLVGKFDVVYSISSVLDLVLLPYVMRIADKKLKWATVFDNTVPLLMDGRFVSGNVAIRLIAWVLFKTSLFFLRSADCLFVIKPELKDYLLRRGFSDRKLVLTGNGVEQDLIFKAEFTEAFKSDALFVGRINEAKGIYDMLEVVKIVKERFPGFRLAIMGAGDVATEKKFKAKIDGMGMSRNVRLLGYKTGQEKFNIIKSSKMFLFLSETESVPIAPLEAVCCGLKALVYDLDAYRMYKNNGVIVFKKHDVAAVARKIIDLFERKDFENEAGRLLIGKFSWNAIAEAELRSFGSC